ncbi:ATP-binding protein [Bradyrhizobium retamae]|uniref:histidine kinase n=1 Tax=Bradyrhizobium retamae TaxID=1300035 RepID=A0A0R3MC78_9BRAD|nr:ATP-binding protein [Bradyrhizobium retamae]KRR17940.1 hypothetical protein CQ13_11295 [Bradyrhizobium retamae]
MDVNGEAHPGDYVMIAVTGTGMTAEVASRAFEPFFTTKEVGKGTGLGLSMVYGFAQQSGESMQMRSEPGHGTAVKLFFPRVGTIQTTAAPSAGQPAAATGSETILVVEDDDMVRRYVEGELKALGYRVIVTPNARDARNIAQPGEHTSSVHGCRDARRHVRNRACEASSPPAASLEDPPDFRP